MSPRSGASSVGRQNAVERADYGVDAPYVPRSMVVIGVVLVVASAGWSLAAHTVTGPLVVTCYGLFALTGAAVYLHTTRRGKFVVWARLLDELRLDGGERVLDLGCGRGAVLLAAARRLSSGRAVGVDLWRTVDQSGNSESVTRANARAEGVGSRVDLRTADMTALPFRDGDFDVVLSALAIHNIPTADGRDAAVAEAVRVLRTGGRLVLVDFRHTRRYAAVLRTAGMRDVRVRSLGWRYWYGGPWAASAAVTAARP